MIYAGSQIDFALNPRDDYRVELRQLLFSLFSFVCIGNFLAFIFVKPAQVSQRYLLYHGVGGASLLLLTLLLFRSIVEASSLPWWVGFLVLSSLFIWRAERHPKTSLLLFFFAALAGMGAIVLSSAVWREKTPPLYTILNALAATWLLGVSLGALLLGHWYLVLPKLPIEELRRMTWALAIGLCIRFLMTTGMAVHTVWGMSEVDLYRYFAGSTAGIFILMRLLWGTVLPLVLTYLVIQTVRIRSTQSATGLLYVVTLAVFTGEIVGLYLTQFHGLSF